MRDAASMQSPQQARGSAKERARCKRLEVHRGAGEILAGQTRRVGAVQDGDPGNARGVLERGPLVAREAAGEPSEAARSGGGIAHDARRVIDVHEPNRAEGVAFERDARVDRGFVTRARALWRFAP